MYEVLNTNEVVYIKMIKNNTIKIVLTSYLV